MGRIRVLPDQVANKIAAGEVVERPASVVKELLENSLDAGSTEVRVEVESGGRRLIRIADDGCGMLRDDALLAFERHATSKLRDVKDLLSIATLGFRGEALPSIASVSRLLLETRSADETTGTRVEIAGGKMLHCDEVALARRHGHHGARPVLQRAGAQEVSALRADRTGAHRVAGDALQPGASGENVPADRAAPASCWHVTPVATLRERVFQVFGSQTLEELVDLGTREQRLELPPPYVPPSEAIAEFRREPEEPSSKTFRLTGFVSRPQVQKGNRNSIFIFVNGRLIRDRLLLHAISSAYYNLMPPAAFPFALLFLECDCEEVDVNVHPSKTEVRFRHQSFVHDFVRDAIRERLMETRPAPAFSPAASAQPAARMPYSEFSQMLENEAAPRGVRARPRSDRLPPNRPWRRPARFRLAARRRDPRRASISAAPPIALADPPPTGRAAAHARYARRVSRSTRCRFPMHRWARCRICARWDRLHESFIIAAGRDGLWIIDQHVAHERILFERVLKQRAGGQRGDAAPADAADRATDAGAADRIRAHRR